MGRKKIVICILASAAILVLGIQGFTALDKILAEQVVITWNKIQAADAPQESGDLESKIIRKGLEGNNLCTFACNVDWGEEIIPDMLDVFDEKGIKITFFVTGRWAEKNPELLREMFARGHEIQSHGYSHALCSQVSGEKVREEIEKTENAVIDILCVKPNLFAPAAGDYDRKTLEIADEMGYRVVLWTSDTIDWREGSSADIIISRIISKPLDGAIILMHPKPETLKALSSLIDEIRSRECNIVPLYRMPVKIYN